MMTTIRTHTHGISDDLAAGLERYAQEIAALGGYGTRVAVMMPNGVERVGELIELGHGGAQPGLRADDGTRYRILGLDRVRVKDGEVIATMGEQCEVQS